MEIAVRSSDPPALFDLSADREIPDRTVVLYDGREVLLPKLLRRELTAAERATVEQRVARLRAALATFQDADQDMVAARISKMLGGFSQMQRRNAAEAVAITNGYLEVLRESGRPAWAIIAACAKVRSGTAGISTEFPPSEATLNHLVSEELIPLRVRLNVAERLLAAKVA